MKNKIIILGFLLAAFGFLSCEDDSLKVLLKDDVSANVLNDLPNSSYILTLEEATNNFPTFSWTAPDFGFPSSISYTVQIDKTGNDFAAAATILTTNNLTGSITIGEFNKKMLDLGLDPDTESDIEVRVRSTVNDNVAFVYSNTISFTVTPYATSFPPIYMIGDATGGWDMPYAVKMRSSAPSEYQVTAKFTKDGKFRFLAEASWDAGVTQYNWSTFEAGSIDSNLTEAGDGDANFIFSGETGWYKITVNLKKKTIVAEATAEPKLYIIGDDQSWTLANAFELSRVEDGVFTGTTTFTKDKIFRFFTAPDWSKGTVNFDYFNGGQVDPLFVNDGGNDKNFKLVGETGEYSITVDLNNLTVVVGLGAPIYMIGDATGGWGLTDAVEMASLGNSKYETIATFTQNGIFRFFKTPAWDATQYKWTTFDGGTIDANLASKGDGDDNFLFTGTTGSYKITVDIPGKSIVMELQ